MRDVRRELGEPEVELRPIATRGITQPECGDGVSTAVGQGVDQRSASPALTHAEDELCFWAIDVAVTEEPPQTLRHVRPVERLQLACVHEPAIVQVAEDRQVACGEHEIVLRRVAFEASTGGRGRCSLHSPIVPNACRNAA